MRGVVTVSILVGSALHGCASAERAGVNSTESIRSDEMPVDVDASTRAVAPDPLGVVREEAPGFGPKAPSVFYSNAVVGLEPVGAGGASQAEVSLAGTRDLVTVSIRAISPEGPSFAECSSTELLVNGKRLPVQHVRRSVLPLNDGTVLETLGFELPSHSIHTLGCTGSFEGRICRSGFELTTGQLEKLREFHSLLVERGLLSPVPEKTSHPPCPEQHRDGK